MLMDCKSFQQFCWKPCGKGPVENRNRALQQRLTALCTVCVQFRVGGKNYGAWRSLFSFRFP